MCPRKEGGKEIMKYVVLVSHGEFANGLKNALSMLTGNKPEIISAGYKSRRRRKPTVIVDRI